MDCSGVIVDIGSDVERFKIGDFVYGTLGVKGGAFAEYVRDDEAIFALKPVNLNYAEAAAIPTACVTSYQALFERLKCTKGTKILICGGSSATGLYAIQLAKSVGALVATTASTRNTELIKKLGE
jgi:NADPH:quinone reductase-like Zn-dependent oxidoreductase